LTRAAARRKVSSRERDRSENARRRQLQRRIGGRHAKEKVRRQASRRPRRSTSAQKSHCRQRDSLPKDEHDQTARSCAEGGANREFGRAMRDRVRDETVDAWSVT
jgi:hypothetical protein